MSRVLLAVAITCLSTLAFASEGSECGDRAACGDLMTTLAGQAGAETVTLVWSSDSEDSIVDRYTIHRYNCPEWDLCLEWVATINAQGFCGEKQGYTYTDAPPGAPEAWRYIVSLWRSDEGQSCSSFADSRTKRGRLP